MTKRCVSITFDVDFDEFGDEKSPNWDPGLAPLDRTAEGAVEYAEACILGEADWPAKVMISCEGAMKRIEP